MFVFVVIEQEIQKNVVA